MVRNVLGQAGVGRTWSRPISSEKNFLIGTPPTISSTISTNADMYVSADMSMSSIDPVSL